MIFHHLKSSIFFWCTLESCCLSHIGDAFVNLRTLQKEINKHLNTCFNQGKNSRFAYQCSPKSFWGSCVFSTQWLLFL